MTQTETHYRLVTYLSPGKHDKAIAIVELKIAEGITESEILRDALRCLAEKENPVTA